MQKGLLGWRFVPGEDESQPVFDKSLQELLDYLRNLVRTAPQHFGYKRTRWTLRMIRDTCWSWLRIGSDAGVWRILHKWRIRRRRGQPHVQSPDPHYDEKRLRVQKLYSDCRSDDTMHVLYMDEASYERQPTPGPCLAPDG